MIIGITGSTAGLGQAIKNRFTDVITFDRHDGNIHNSAQVFEKLKNSDCFINNAYDGSCQINLLNIFFKNWHSLPKKIINIGSTSCSYKPSGTPNEDYIKNKVILKKTHREIVSKQSKCKSFLVNFGLIETKMTNMIQEKKLTIDQAVDKILYVIDSKEYIPEIYIYA